MNLIPGVSPIAAGGACFLNKANARGEFIDTGVENDQYTPYGRICLSKQTVEHMARLIGWAPAEEVEALYEDLAVATAERDDALEKAEKFGSVVTFLGEAANELALAGDS